MLDEKQGLVNGINRITDVPGISATPGKDMACSAPAPTVTGENGLAASIAALDAPPAPEPIAPAPAETSPKTPFYRRRSVWISAICLVAIALIATCVLVYAPLPTVKKDGMTFTRRGDAYVLADAKANLTHVTSPSTVRDLPVTEIGDFAFHGCSSLTEVTIPDSVTTIGNSALYDCASLTSVTIPDSVTSIGNWAFSYCTSLISVTIPDSVTSIGEFAFRDCTSLISVTIPDSVTSIGYCTFYHCASLTSVTIPDSITSIGDCAFRDCTSLTSVTIPDSVTSIGYCAFYDCALLTSVTIPESVTSIGGFAFYGCTSLTIYCEATSKPSGWESNWNYSNRPVVWGYTGE